jgi:hypothetical protein
MTRHTQLKGLAWVCVDALACCLDAADRDAVLGDLHESSASPWSAAADVAGLVARRQVAAWGHPRAWAALLTIALPIGWILSHESRWVAHGVALDVRLYVVNWTSAYLASPGSRANLLHLAFDHAAEILALIGWSWTVGFVLGVISRRTLVVTGVAFCLIVGLGTVGTHSVASHDGLLAHLYGVVFPRLVRLGAVVAPAVLGAWASGHGAALSLPRAALGVVLLSALTYGEARGLEASVTIGRGVFLPVAGPDRTYGTTDDFRPVWPISLIVLWPAVFVLARSISWPATQTGRTSLER